MSKIIALTNSAHFLASLLSLHSGFISKPQRTWPPSKGATRGASSGWLKSMLTCPRPFPVRPRARSGAALMQVLQAGLFSRNCT